MVWIRYVAYFIAITFFTWAITQFELASPGGLKLHVVVNETDQIDATAEEIDTIIAAEHERFPDRRISV